MRRAPEQETELLELVAEEQPALLPAEPAPSPRAQLRAPAWGGAESGISVLTASWVGPVAQLSSGQRGVLHRAVPDLVHLSP